MNHCFLTFLFLVSTLCIEAQDYTVAEAAKYADVKIEIDSLKSVWMNDINISDTDITPERFGEVLRAGLSGRDIALSPEEEAALKELRARVFELEQQWASVIDSIALKNKLSLQRYQDLDTLFRVSREFKYEVNQILLRKSGNNK
jgi:hypothetical protein